MFRFVAWIVFLCLSLKSSLWAGGPGGKRDDRYHPRWVSRPGETGRSLHRAPGVERSGKRPGSYAAAAAAIPSPRGSDAHKEDHSCTKGADESDYLGPSKPSKQPRSDSHTPGYKGGHDEKGKGCTKYPRSKDHHAQRSQTSGSGKSYKGHRRHEGERERHSFHHTQDSLQGILRQKVRDIYQDAQHFLQPQNLEDWLQDIERLFRKNPDASYGTYDLQNVTQNLKNILQQTRGRQAQALRRVIQNDELQAYFKVSAAHMGSMDPRTLSTILYSLSVIDIAPPLGWQERFWIASYKKLAQFDAQGFSNTLYALAQLQLKPDPLWMDRFWGESKGQLAQFKPQELSNTLYALAKLNIQPEEKWMTTFWGESKGQLAQFKPQELSNSLYALGQLQVKPDPLWMKAFWAESKGQLAQFIPQHFSNTLYALGQLQVKPDPLWMKAFWAESYKKLAQFKPQELSNTLYALGQLQIKPDPLWMDRFWAASQDKLTQFNAQDFSNTLYALGQLQIKPEEKWMTDFWTESQNKLAQFRPQELSNTLYALVMLNLSIDPAFLSHIQQLNASLLPLEGLRQLYVCNQLIQGLQINLPHNTLERLTEDAKAKNSTSKLEAGTGPLIEKALEEGQTLEASSWIETSATFVDFFVPEAKLVIQVDGPSHFLSNGQPNGSTALQNRLFEKTGYKVVRLHHKELDKKHAAAEYVKNQIQAALEDSPK